MITTKQLAIEALGPHAVQDYETVKAFYMRLGHELAHGFAAAIGATHGTAGQPDITTPQGTFEVCAGPNTKNHAGDQADQARGRRVQLTGRARQGYLSGEQLLALHHIDPKRADKIRLAAALRASRSLDHQTRMRI